MTPAKPGSPVAKALAKVSGAKTEDEQQPVRRPARPSSAATGGKAPSAPLTAATAPPAPKAAPGRTARPLRRHLRPGSLLHLSLLRSALLRGRPLLELLLVLLRPGPRRPARRVRPRRTDRVRQRPPRRGRLLVRHPLPRGPGDGSG